MARSKLQTTTIGSFPKPDFLPIRDWFDAARSEGSMNSPKQQPTLRITVKQTPMMKPYTFGLLNG